MPVVRTDGQRADGRAVYGHAITKFSGMGRFTYPWCSTGALRAPELRYHLQISLARRSTCALVKDRFLRSTISLWMSTGWLEISSNSGLFTCLDVPTEKNWTLLCFSWSVSSFVYSNPRVLNPSVMATTALFTSARGRVSPLKKR